MNQISYEKVVNPTGSSFRIENYSHAFFEAPLHIHTEYELISIEKGHGLAFVGDSVHRFAPGDFMLIGKNLPHLWLSAEEYYENNTLLMSASVYSQFDINLFPDDALQIPEFDSIRSLLSQSQRGLLFMGEKKSEVQESFRQLPSRPNFEKLLRIYSILHELSCHCKYCELTTSHYQNPLEKGKNDPILKRTYTVISEKYQDDLALQDIADYVGMNPSALCRYFKKKTGKTIFEHLTETRISYAVKLLISRKIPINQIAYDCGYNNLSHFNRQFKNVTGTTPREYNKLLSINKT